MAARRERSQLKIRNSDAADFFDGMAGLEKPVAKGVAAGLRKRDDVPWRFFAFDALDVRSCCASQRFDLSKCEQRFHLDLVCLPQAMRSQELIREIAVIGEKHQARCMVFESTDRENAL
jgi:hypothetical protein